VRLAHAPYAARVVRRRWREQPARRTAAAGRQRCPRDPARVAEREWQPGCRVRRAAPL